MWPGSPACHTESHMGRAIFAFLLVSTCFAADSGAGIRWTAPSGWKAEAERPMRLGTYTVAPGAECAVYFFGSGQGGSVDANVDRWVGQFVQADGKPSRSAAKISAASPGRLGERSSTPSTSPTNCAPTKSTPKT